jgi:AraC-like DNA-binding protein
MRLGGLVQSLHGCDGMAVAAQIREWLQETLAREPGLTVEKWAQRAGIAKSTIFRAMKPEYEFVTSSKTLGKLASAVGVDPPSFASNVNLARLELPVRYRVQAGLWYENEADQPPEQRQLSVRADPRFEDVPQWLEEVVGDSANLKIPAGHYIHVIDAIALGYVPKHGDWVVVERHRDQGGVRERTVKQVDIKDGQIRLAYRSSNPKWVGFVDVTAGCRPGGDTEVVIVGKVHSAIDPNF